MYKVTEQFLYGKIEFFSPFSSTCQKVKIGALWTALLLKKVFLCWIYGKKIKPYYNIFKCTKLEGKFTRKNMERM